MNNFFEWWWKNRTPKLAIKIFLISVTMLILATIGCIYIGLHSVAALEIIPVYGMSILLSMAYILWIIVVYEYCSSEIKAFNFERDEIMRRLGQNEVIH
jgi:hypothetical protein